MPAMTEIKVSAESMFFISENKPPAFLNVYPVTACGCKIIKKRIPLHY